MKTSLSADWMSLRPDCAICSSVWRAGAPTDECTCAADGIYSERANKNAVQLADVLSPISRKKTGRAYVALARSQSNKSVIIFALFPGSFC